MDTKENQPQGMSQMQIQAGHACETEKKEEWIIVILIGANFEGDNSMIECNPKISKKLKAITKLIDYSVPRTLNHLVGLNLVGQGEVIE
ncbi:MAG TPA: hypothetical protein VET47_00085 [Candidatus Limnocylindrales bacterium]|nr:hypothetical protein [Candidatus Limnocylindrales bacterium]